MSGKLASLLGRMHGAPTGPQASTARKRQKTSHKADGKRTPGDASAAGSGARKLQGLGEGDLSDSEDDVKIDEAGAYSALIGIMSKKRGAHAAALKQRQQEEGGDSEPEDSEEVSLADHLVYKMLQEPGHHCLLQHNNLPISGGKAALSSLLTIAGVPFMHQQHACDGAVSITQHSDLLLKAH